MGRPAPSLDLTDDPTWAARQGPCWLDATVWLLRRRKRAALQWASLAVVKEAITFWRAAR